MRFVLYVLLTITGCISVGGGVTLNASLDGAPTRHIGGALEVGNFVEIVESELFGQLLHVRSLGPLGQRSEVLGAWGARFTRAQRRGLPGFYVHGAYGRNDPFEQSFARTVIAGAGVAYARIDESVRGRAWTSIQLGAVYHRSHQLTVNDSEVGHFLGLELSVHLGFDTIGPMFANDDASGPTGSPFD